MKIKYLVKYKGKEIPLEDDFSKERLQELFPNIDGIEEDTIPKEYEEHIKSILWEEIIDNFFSEIEILPVEE